MTYGKYANDTILAVLHDERKDPYLNVLKLLRYIRLEMGGKPLSKYRIATDDGVVPSNRGVDRSLLLQITFGPVCLF